MLTFKFGHTKIKSKKFIKAWKEKKGEYLAVNQNSRPGRLVKNIKVTQSWKRNIQGLECRKILESTLFVEDEHSWILWISVTYHRKIMACFFLC
jgi:hypothetical protein